jgi:hypothetical protein
MVSVQFACRTQVRPVPVNEAPAPQLHRPDIVVTLAQLPFKFVAYGDIRFTSPGPIRNREVSNPEARRALVTAIAEKKPAFVVITGDLVWRGPHASDWNYWEQETMPFAAAKLPLFPVVGNHEYLAGDFVGSGREAGLRNFFAHFPQLPNRPATPWYAVEYSNSYFLMLDSNDDDSPASAQMEWVRAQLDSLPPEIAYVFVILHRPILTSATDRIHRPRLAEQELGKMLEERQQRAPRLRFVVISGHVHNYEHFEHNGVTYIVSGGGGATPHALRRAASDLYHPQDPNEVAYHYCLISVERDKLKVEMYRLSDERPGKLEVRDSFELPAGAR